MGITGWVTLLLALNDFAPEYALGLVVIAAIISALFRSTRALAVYGAPSSGLYLLAAGDDGSNSNHGEPVFRFGDVEVTTRESHRELAEAIPEMGKGALEKAKVDLAVALTGIAGPGGATPSGAVPGGTAGSVPRWPACATM